MKKNIFLIALLLPIFCFGNTRVVKTVHSGDLLELEGGFKFKLTGISAPDKSTHIGYKVYDFTKRTVEGKVVKMSTWTTNSMASGIVHNEEGLAFAQIYFGNGSREKGSYTNLNELLLKKGYAKVNTKYLPKNCEHFKELEKTAREQNLGLWANQKDNQ